MLPFIPISIPPLRFRHLRHCWIKIPLLYPKTQEPHPGSQAFTQNPDLIPNSKTGVDYEPHPEHSIQLDDERQNIIDSICRLYSGSSSVEDTHIYAEKAIYDGLWS